VLHPRHKLRYFNKAGWKADWITTARNIVRDEYQRSYAGRTILAQEQEMTERLQCEMTKVMCTMFLLHFY